MPRGMSCGGSRGSRESGGSGGAGAGCRTCFVLCCVGPPL